MPPEPHQENTRGEYSGYLVFVMRWKGSKSERFFPCLLGANAEIIWLKHREDNSFNPMHLEPFHLTPVQILGTLDASGQLLVESINVVEDPWGKCSPPTAQ